MSRPYKYKNGIYYTDFKDATGRRIRVSTGSRNKRVAEEFQRQLELERALPQSRDPLPLGRALWELEKYRTASGRSEATLKKIREKARTLVERLGEDRDVHTITHADCQEYLLQRRRIRTYEDANGSKKRRKQVSLHSVHMELATLRAALNVCKKLGLYHGDPKTVMVDGLEGAYQPKERWLTVEEAKLLLAELNPVRIAEVTSGPVRELPHDYREHFTVYLGTGVRHSELYKIRAEHLDHRNRQVLVEGTKTRQSTRWIPCTGEVWGILWSRADMYPSGPLFPDVWDATLMRNALRRAAKRAGIEPLSANDLRRTFASWMAQAGVPEMTIARLMGHTTSSMVRRIYAQQSPDVFRDAVEELPVLGS